MRPIVFKGKILLPFANTVGSLLPGDLFKRNERSGVRIVMRKENDYIIVRDFSGKKIERLTTDYPIIQLL